MFELPLVVYTRKIVASLLILLIGLSGIDFSLSTQQMEIFMFEKIKNFFSGFVLFFKYGDVVRSFTTAYTTYPGLDDADRLRVWIRPLLTDASSLATITRTKVDDMIVYAAVRIVDDEHAWTAVHAMAMLLRHGMASETVLVPGDTDDMFETVRKVSEEVMPQCPSAVLTAIGIILFLLQRRSNQK